MSWDVLAAKAGISIGYLTQLEQRRAAHPSPEVVDRLADALGATAAERTYLHNLTLEPVADRIRSGSRVTSAMRQAVDHLDPHLAGYVDELSNVLHVNAECARVYRRITEVGNVLVWFFDVREARAILPDWGSRPD